MSVDVGDKAPDFSMPTAGGGTISLSDLKGGKAIVFFYPKADTPGCTKECIAFTEQLPDFSGLGAQVIGISKDKVAKLEKFRDKHDLKITLASDEEGDVTERFGSWVEKSMYGKKYMGIDRSTFLIDEKGVIQSAWRKVKVPGHVDAVKEALEGA
ncbi:MAG: thioredoxin-dependent thiol peroxidase [Pseudomonadota bacterium]